MKRCKHCKIPTRQVNTVGETSMLVHVEPGNPPYRFCKYAVAEVDTPLTVGEWAAKMLGPIR